MSIQRKNLLRLAKFFVANSIFCGLPDGGPRLAAAEPREKAYPEVAFKDQDGKDVSLNGDMLKGKITIISFMYTGCELCDLGTRNLVQVQKALGDRLGKDVFLYSITVDPRRDTPAKLKEYAVQHGAQPGWSFLTASSEEVLRVQKRFGMANLTPEMRARMGLPKLDPAAAVDPKRHSGMMLIINDDFNKRMKTGGLTAPCRVQMMINEMTPTRNR